MRIILLFVALFALPLSVFAQTYKCKQADGRVSFQDQACQGAAAGAKIDVRPATVTERSTEVQKFKENSETKKMTSPRQQKLNELEKVRKQEVDDNNRSMRCNGARHDLEVLKVERPVYRYDNKGEKQFIEDTNRQSEVNAAQRRMTENCK